MLASVYLKMCSITFDDYNRLDKAAVEKAIADLEIKLPVFIRISAPYGYRGTWGPTLTGHAITLDPEMLDYENVHAGRESIPEVPQSPLEALRSSLSYTLWHELSHAKDYETRAKRNPKRMIELQEIELAKFYAPLLELSLDDDVFLEHYFNLPPEQFADKIAQAKHAINPFVWLADKWTLR